MLQWDAAVGCFVPTSLRMTWSPWVICNDATVLGAWRGGRECWDVREGLPKQPPSTPLTGTGELLGLGLPCWDVCLGFAHPQPPWHQILLLQGHLPRCSPAAAAPRGRSILWAAQNVNFKD